MSKLPITHREMRELAETALDDGWTIEQTQGGRLKWIVPGGGESFFTGVTCKDHRAVKNIERDMRLTLRRAEESSKRLSPPRSQAAPEPLKAPLLSKIHRKTVDKFRDIAVGKALTDFVKDLEKDPPQKKEKPVQTSSPVKIESRPKQVPPAVVLPKPLPVAVQAPEPAVSAPPPPTVMAMLTTPPAPSGPKEKPIISFEEAVKLIVDDIEHHNTWPPRAADAVFELYRVRTMRSMTGDPKFYSSGNSIHAAICIRYPRYKTRGGNRPYIPPTPPVASENPPPPLPSPPPAPAPAADPKSQFETQVRGIMEMPGLSDEKRQAMLRLLLEK